MRFRNYSKTPMIRVDYPLSIAVIAKHQQKDANLVQLKRHPEYFTKRVDGHNVILVKIKYIYLQYLEKKIKNGIIQHSTILE
jgi:hypothetical protein